MSGTQQRTAMGAQEVAYDFEQETSSARVFPVRFLGMGLFIAWLSCTHISLIFPGPGCDLDARTAFDMGMRVGDIGTFVMLALLARRIGVLSRHPSTCFALAALCAAGTAFIGLVAMPAGLHYNLIFAFSVPTAIGGAVLFCLWGQVYCSMGMTQAGPFLHCGFSYVGLGGGLEAAFRGDRHSAAPAGLYDCGGSFAPGTSVGASCRPFSALPHAVEVAGHHGHRQLHHGRF